MSNLLNRFTISSDSYYAQMYDLEELTALNSASRIFRDDKTREIETQVRSDRCREAKRALVEKNRIGPTLASVIMAEGLRIKELLFRNAIDEHEDLSPKECALRELEAYLDVPRNQFHRPMLVEVPVSQAWKEMGVDSNNSESVLNFYRQTDSYIYELMAANHVIQTLYSFGIMQRKIASLPIKNILDYGAGAGTLSILLAQSGLRPVYLDLESPMMTFARWRFERRGLDIPIIDVETCDITSLKKDAILCTEVVEHVSDVPGLLNMLCNVLTPGQHMIISESCEYVEQFCSHLPQNLQYGGERFIDLMRQRGYKQVLTQPYVPQMFFCKELLAR